jgi:hypothetical protein
MLYNLTWSFVGLQLYSEIFFFDVTGGNYPLLDILRKEIVTT